MRRSLLLGLLLLGLVTSALLVALPSQAFNEPDGFRGIPWGASEAVLTEKISGAECRDRPADAFLTAHRVCFGRFTVGAVPVTASFTLKQDGGLVSVHLRFDEKHFPEMATAFRERYGAPTGTETKTYRNRLGAAFVGVEHRWIGDRVHITVTQYQGTLTKSAASLSLRDFLTEAGQRKQQEDKKAADDL